MIVDELASWVLNALTQASARLAVKDLCVGVRYTYALLTDGSRDWMGLAITPLEDLAGTPFEDPGTPTLEALEDLVSSPHPLRKALGVALLNAASAYLLWGARYGVDFALRTGPDAIDLLGRVEEPVAVVGNMGPLIRRLRAAGLRDIRVVERNPCCRCGAALPDTAAYRLLPGSATVIATGATLVNDTLDAVLALARGAKIVLVGPTAAAHPKPLLDLGVHAVLSMHPVNIGETARLVKLGGGRWSFSKHCRHYAAYRPA